MELPSDMNKPLHIFIDSDAFVGLAKQDDTNHDKAIALLQKLSKQEVSLITSNYVIAESITVISQRESHKAAVGFIHQMQSGENIFRVQKADVKLDKKAMDIFEKQTSKSTSFIDCTNMAIMTDLHVGAIFSFDHVYQQNGFTLIENLF